MRKTQMFLVAVTLVLGCARLGRADQQLPAPKSVPSSGSEPKDKQAENSVQPSSGECCDPSCADPCHPWRGDHHWWFGRRFFAERCGNRGFTCRRFWEWLLYRPQCCAGCCRWSVAPCCTPPLYAYFLCSDGCVHPSPCPVCPPPSTYPNSDMNPHGAAGTHDPFKRDTIEPKGLVP